MFRLYTLILATLLLITLTSCSRYTDVIDVDKTKIKYIESTQKGEMYSALETVAIISATYMNKVEPQNYNNGIYLLAGVYYPAVSTEDNIGIDAEYLSVYIASEGTRYPIKSFRALRADDPLLLHMPLFNSWSDYYLLEFQDVGGSYFDFVVDDKRRGKIVLPFAR